MDKSQVAEYFEVDSDAVVKVREEDEGATICALIDYGIGGIKVYVEPVEAFKTPAPKPKPKPAPEPLPVPAVIDFSSAPLYNIGLDQLSYRELQARARDENIPANQSAQALRDALRAAEEEEL